MCVVCSVCVCMYVCVVCYSSVCVCMYVWCVVCVCDSAYRINL